jgi:hypothetical protein
MATYYPKYYYQDAVGMAETSLRPRWLYNTIDFAVQNVNTGDTVNMIPIPAFSILHVANYRTVTTVTSGSATFVIGDGTKTFVASAAAVSAGSWGATPAIANTNTNVFYAAKSNIQINTVATANLTAGQIQVWALMSYPTPLSYVDVDGVTHTYTYTDRNNWTTTAPVIP